MEIDDIKAFVAVADAGSMSRAASELYLTQPAVTRRVQRLEVALGTRLLDRRQRPFALTEAGRVTLERSRRVLTALQELRALTAETDSPTWETPIGVAHALTELTLWEPVEHLRRAFPRVSVRLRSGWSRELLERVRAGSLDGAVILLPERERPPASLNGERLGQERLVVVAGRKQSRPTYRRPADLAGVGWVLNPEGCNGRALLQRVLTRAGVALRVDVEAYSYELQIRLVARNRGLGLVPARILARSRLARRLERLRIPGLDFVFSIWSVRGQTSREVEAVLEELSRRLHRP